VAASRFHQTKFCADNVTRGKICVIAASAISTIAEKHQDAKPQLKFDRALGKSFPNSLPVFIK